MDEQAIFRTLVARVGRPPFFVLTRIIHCYDEIEQVAGVARNS